MGERLLRAAEVGLPYLIAGMAVVAGVVQADMALLVAAAAVVVAAVALEEARALRREANERVERQVVSLDRLRQELGDG